MTLSFTPQMNYARLFIAWTQLIGMGLLVLLTVICFRSTTADLSAIPKTHRVYRRLDAVLSVADTALLLLLEAVVAPDGLHRLGKASAFSGSFGDDRWVAAPPEGVTATGAPLRHRRIKGRYPV